MNQQPNTEGNTMDIVTQNSQFMSGASCFAGARLPVATLLDNLNDCTTFTQVI